MDTPWKLISLVFIILFAFSVLLGISGAYSPLAGSSLFSKSASPSDSAQVAVSFIRNNLIGADESVTLLNVTEESGVYRISTKFSSSKGQQTIDAYMSRDGKYLFPASYRIDDISKNRNAEVTTATTPVAVTKNCANIKKQDIPVMEAFVVSYCPYGTQIQGVLAEVVAKIPDLSKNIKVRYLGGITNGTVQSMHGSIEATENLRQICIREEQPAAYWKYISCFISSHQTDTCQKTAGVDITQITECTNDTTRGLKYAGEDFARSYSYGATASPTLILNGVRVSEFNFGGRTPEAIKSLLCCGFGTQPEGCGISLASNQVPAVSAGEC